MEWILDKAIQVHGAGGLSRDLPLAAAFAAIRTLRLADGPDEVHKNALARTELKRQRAGETEHESRDSPDLWCKCVGAAAAKTPLSSAWSAGRR